MSAGILLSAVGACLLGGVLPWISNEAVVAGAVLLLSREWIPVLVLGASAAQLTAKTGVFALARWAPHRLPRKAQGALARSHRLVAGRPRRMALVLLVSAAVGVPPFYLTTLAAGAGGTSLALFLSAGGAGVVVRTGAVAWVATTTLNLRDSKEDPMITHRDTPIRRTSAGAALSAVVAATAALVAPAPLAAQAPQMQMPAVRSLAVLCRAPGARDEIAHEVAHALAAVKAGGPEAHFHQALDHLEATLPAEDASVEAAYHRAVILGARVDVLGGRDQVEAAGRLHQEVEAILAQHPDHGGAHHLLGRLHAGVVRLGGFKRTVARILYGGELLSRASWSAARAHLEAGEQGAPCLAEHHYELARVLAETGDLAGAQREVGHVLELTRDGGTTGAADPRAAGLRVRALELLDGV